MTEMLLGRRRPVPARAAGAGLQGRAPGRAPLGDLRRGRADPAHREVGAVRDPVGRALDHRHHRHRLAARPRPPGRVGQGHRVPARPGQHGARPAADHDRTSRASTPGCGRCCRGEDESTSALSREHAVVEPMLGLMLVAGGKLTTYRVMAADVVDRAVRRLGGASAALPHRRAAAARRRRLRRGCGATRPAWPAATASRSAWSSTCWSATARSPVDVLGLLRRRPELGRPLARRARLPRGRDRVRRPGRGRAAPGGRAGPAYPDLVRDRAPRRRERRRTRPSSWARCSAGTRRQRGREIEHYLARVEAERESQRMPDDLTADAARLGAPDVRAVAGRRQLVIYIDRPRGRPAGGSGRIWSATSRSPSCTPSRRLLGAPRRGFDRDHYDVPAERYAARDVAGRPPGDQPRDRRPAGPPPACAAPNTADS